MPEPGPPKKLCVKKTVSFKSAKHVPVALAGMQHEVPPVDFLVRFKAAFAEGFRPCDMVQDEHGTFSRAMPHDTWRAMREQGFA